MLIADGEVDSAKVARVRCVWKKFFHLPSCQEVAHHDFQMSGAQTEKQSLWKLCLNFEAASYHHHHIRLTSVTPKHTRYFRHPR